MLTLVSRFTPHVSRFLGAGRERHRLLWIVRRSRTVNVGQAPSLCPSGSRQNSVDCADMFMNQASRSSHYVEEAGTYGVFGKGK